MRALTDGALTDGAFTDGYRIKLARLARHARFLDSRVIGLDTRAMNPQSLHGDPVAAAGVRASGLLLPERRKSLRAGEIALWCLVAALALMLRALIVGGPELSNDSFQYLVTAENFRRAEPAATSIVHFDAERMHGRLPAPLTTFPSGYPLLIALVSLTGLSGAQGGALLSALATIAVLLMFSRAAALLGTPVVATRVLIGVLATSSSVLISGNQVMAESLFMALAFGALLLLLLAQAERSERRQLGLHLAANVLIAGACWVRYAGLFLFAAIAFFHGARWLATRTGRSFRALAAMALSAVLIGAALWRNYLLVGDWKGGNTKVVENDLLEVLYKFPRSLHHVFLGDAPARLGLAEGLLALALMGVLAYGLRPLWLRWRAIVADPHVQLLAVSAGVYAGAMVYMGLRSAISFGPRMFVPIVPVLLLLAAALCAHAAQALTRSRLRAAMPGALAVLVGAYAAINLPVLMTKEETPLERVRARLEAPTSAGTSLRSRIEQEAGPNSVLFSTDGQATGYLLRRPTVSLVSPLFSDKRWTEDAVREEMDRFGAKHVLVYAGPHDSDSVVSTSAFLTALASGVSPPWLRLAADNGRARLYARRDIQ